MQQASTSAQVLTGQSQTLTVRDGNVHSRHCKTGVFANLAEPVDKNAAVLQRTQQDELPL